MSRHRAFKKSTKGNEFDPNKATTGFAAVVGRKMYTTSYNSDVVTIVDTGLSHHMTDQRFFTRLQPCNVQLESIAGHAVALLAT